VEEAKNTDNENSVVVEEAEIKDCPVCGDAIDNTAKCCDKCMLDLVGIL